MCDFWSKQMKQVLFFFCFLLQFQTVNEETVGVGKQFGFCILCYMLLYVLYVIYTVYKIPFPADAR